MKKYIILFISILIYFPGYSQVVKLENGMSISNFQSPTNPYDRSIKSYMIAASISYLITPHYEILSKIGFYNKGGIKDIMVNSETITNIASNVRNKMGYLHLNTNIRGKLPIKNFSIFAGCGPKIDILMNSRSNVNRINLGETALNLANDKLHRVIFGLVPEVGIMYELNRMRLEFNSLYIYDMNHIDNQNFKLKGNSLLLIISVGYKL